MTSSGPAGRIRGGLAEDADRHRMLLFAGHDDQSLGERNDLWALDLTGNVWTKLREGDSLNQPGSGFCDFPKDFTTPDLESPERRDGISLDICRSQSPLCFRRSQRLRRARRRLEI